MSKMKNLTMKQKADLFDAMFDQEKIEIVDVEELGNPNYQHISLRMWTNHLDSGTKMSQLTTKQSKEVILEYLVTHLNSL